MKEKIKDYIEFRADKLFNGAVDISWFTSDLEKNHLASKAYIFHGPKYHAAKQDEFASISSHKLIDSVSFVKKIVQTAEDKKNFILAIAGYGTGKSHLGLTIANLLNRTKKSEQEILNALSCADRTLYSEIFDYLASDTQPSLVITLNGMQNFALANEIIKQASFIISSHGYSTKPLEDLRPRFQNALNLLEVSNDEVKSKVLKATNLKSYKNLVDKLKSKDEDIYKIVSSVFSESGLLIQAISGESIREIFDLLASEYCGSGKPYKSVVILFDEFGKYLEFSAVKSHIAGSGALQDLFEGIQSNSDKVFFVGFIQYELNAYVQRVSPEYKNELLRYITRYENAEKLYLSVNLETIIANLIEKKKETELEEYFTNRTVKQETKTILKKISQWFPQTNNYKTWCDEETFHTIIRKGCWPLNPFATWTMYYLASAGKYLQERSVLAMLGETFKNRENKSLDTIENTVITATDLWSESLENQLKTSEENGVLGNIMHSYLTAIERNQNILSHSQTEILKAIVLASKLSLNCVDQDDGKQAIAELTGLNISVVEEDIELLREEFNIIEWDPVSKYFDILSDTISKTQFISFLRQRKNRYDSSTVTKLFTNYAEELFGQLIDLDCDYAELKDITTKEWSYKSSYTDLDYLMPCLKMSYDRWLKSYGVDEPRGSAIFIYLPENQDIESCKKYALNCINDFKKTIKTDICPLIIIFLYDSQKELYNSLVEYEILSKLTKEEEAKFGKLVELYREKTINQLKSTVINIIKERHYVTTLLQQEETRRLNTFYKEIFEEIYPEQISFPFDGFSTVRGNAADDCHTLTLRLLSGNFDYNQIISSPPKTKNRAVRVLAKCWDIFSVSGDVSRKPGNKIISKIFTTWDDLLDKKQPLSIQEMITTLILPPYGANIASAGLILGVFCQSRINELIINKSGQSYSINNWATTIFKSKYIDVKETNNCFIQKIGKEAAEWDVLLDEWEKAVTYEEHGKYFERAEILNKKTAMPPAITYKYQMLIERKEKINEKFEKALLKNKKLIEEIDNACNSNNIGTLIHKADDARIELDVITESKDLPSYIEKELEQCYEFAVRTIKESFYLWLEKQKPKTFYSNDLAGFNGYMKSLIKKLPTIGLIDEKEIIEKYTQNITAKADKVTAALEIQEKAKKWYETNCSVDTIMLIKIDSIISEGEIFIKQLSEYSKQDLLESSSRTLIQNIEAIVKKFTSLKEDINEKADMIFDLEKITCDNYLDVTKDLNMLVEAYTRQDDDQEEFTQILDVLTMVKKQADILSEPLLTNDQLKIALKTAKEKVKKETQELEYEFKPTDLLESFYAKIENDREERSKQWYQNIEKTITALKNPTNSEIKNILAQLESYPPYLLSKHKKQIEIQKDSLLEKYNQQTLDWLFGKFQELPDVLKSEFIKKATGTIKKKLGNK